MKRKENYERKFFFFLIFKFKNRNSSLYKYIYTVFFYYLHNKRKLETLKNLKYNQRKTKVKIHLKISS